MTLLKKEMVIIFLLVITLVSFQGNLSIYAQDHHYWTNMGGTRSALMSGAVIGGVRDNSAGYYNPAGLAFITKTSHSISSDTYQWENIIINNALGGSVDFKSNQIQIIPTLVSGIFQIDFIPWLKVSYSIAAKDFSFIKSSDSFNDSRDVLETISEGYYLGNDSFTDLFAGKEDYSGQYIYDASLSEYWAGVSWSEKISDNFSLGITLFLVYRSQSQIHNTNLFASDKQGYKQAGNQVLNSIEFWNFRLVPKFGFMWISEIIRAGMTITSPSVNILGQGTINGIILSNDIVYEQTNDRFYQSVDLNINGRWQDLTSLYKTPLSIAAGVETNITDDLLISVTSEYFFRVSEYTVVKPDYALQYSQPGESSRITDNNWLHFKDRRNAVLNTGAGIEYTYNNFITGYVSFRTNFRNNKNRISGGNTLGITDWDIYHFTSGAIYKLDNQEISLSFNGSYGSNKHSDQFENLPALSGVDNKFFISVVNMNTSATYWSLGATLGFTYYLN